MLKAHTLDRGGLSVAHQALEDLLNDPKELDRGRCRLGQPPPVYRSYTPSGTTTQFPIPDRRTEEERWREKRSWQLREAYYASLPYNQLEVEVLEESKRISEGVEKKTYNAPVGKDFVAIAQENVEERWANRGIWNNKWERGSGVVWRWKHEEPPDVPTPKAELEQQSPTRRPLSPAIMETPNPYLSARECDEELQKNNEIRERERERERERDVSRPFHQFFYQVSEARERIQQQPGESKEDVTYSADVNTTAYEEVKKAWINRGIWDRKWSVVPGMSWKHEGRTIEEFLEEEMKLPENAYPGDTIPHEGSDQEVDESMGMDMGEIYSRWNSVLASPAESDQETPYATNIAQEGPVAFFYPSNLPNANLNPSPQYPSPQPPPKRKRPRGRPPRKSEPEKLCIDPPPQGSPPAPLRRSKRLREAEVAKTTDTTSAPVAPVNRRGRPKRSGTQGANSADAVSKKALRASKRQQLKQKKN